MNTKHYFIHANRLKKYSVGNACVIKYVKQMVTRFYTPLLNKQLTRGLHCNYAILKEHWLPLLN